MTPGLPSRTEIYKHVQDDLQASDKVPSRPQSGVDVFIQGNLQSVFDVLYQMGVIDPVLKLDWQKAMQKLPSYSSHLEAAVKVVNVHQGNPNTLAHELQKFDSKTLEFLAMEVARELADYHSRTLLH